MYVGTELWPGSLSHRAFFIAVLLKTRAIVQCSSILFIKMISILTGDKAPPVRPHHREDLNLDPQQSVTKEAGCDGRKLGLMVCLCNRETQEAEVGNSLQCAG